MLRALRLAPPTSSVDAALWELLYKSQFVSPTDTLSPTDNLSLEPRAITHMSPEVPLGATALTIAAAGGRSDKRKNRDGGDTPLVVATPASPANTIAASAAVTIGAKTDQFFGETGTAVVMPACRPARWAGGCAGLLQPNL